MDLHVLLASEGRSLPLDEDATFIVKDDGSHTRNNLMVAEMEIGPEFVPPVQHVHHARVPQ